MAVDTVEPCGPCTGAEEDTQVFRKLHAMERSRISQNGNGDGRRRRGRWKREAYRRAEQMRASSSSAPRGRMRGMEAREGVLTSGERRSGSGVTRRWLRSGCMRRWLTEMTARQRLGAGERGRVASLFCACASGRRKKQLTGGARGVSERGRRESESGSAGAASWSGSNRSTRAARSVLDG